MRDELERRLERQTQKILAQEDALAQLRLHIDSRDETINRHLDSIDRLEKELEKAKLYQARTVPTVSIMIQCIMKHLPPDSWPPEVKKFHELCVDRYIQEAIDQQEGEPEK